MPFRTSCQATAIAVWSEPLRLDSLEEKIDTLAEPIIRNSIMSSRSLYRRHSAQFKLPLCTDIRNGKIGRRAARRTDQISANLIQLWLSQYDRGELNAEEATATTISEYEAQIAALERKVGPLTMEIDWFKKTPRRPLDTNSVISSIVSGPLASPSSGGVE